MELDRQIISTPSASADQPYVQTYECCTQVSHVEVLRWPSKRFAVSRSMSVIRFRGQSYEAERARCLASRELFIDQQFPPIPKSVLFSRVADGVEWRRPRELCAAPRLAVRGPRALTPHDLQPGSAFAYEPRSRWFVSACVWLTRHPRLFARVVPNIGASCWRRAHL